MNVKAFLSLFNEKKFELRSRCLVPGCDERPIGCHLIASKYIKELRGYQEGCDFRKKVLVPSGPNLTRHEWKRTGINSKLMKHPTFCNEHDFEIFKDIEAVGLPSSENAHHIRLLNLKAIADAYSKVRSYYLFFQFIDENITNEKVSEIYEAYSADEIKLYQKEMIDKFEKDSEKYCEIFEKEYLSVMCDDVGEINYLVALSEVNGDIFSLGFSDTVETRNSTRYGFPMTFVCLPFLEGYLSWSPLCRQ